MHASIMPNFPKIMPLKSVSPIHTIGITQPLRSVPTAPFEAMFSVTITRVRTRLTSHCALHHAGGTLYGVVVSVCWGGAVKAK